MIFLKKHLRTAYLKKLREYLWLPRGAALPRPSSEPERWSDRVEFGSLGGTRPALAPWKN